MPGDPTGPADEAPDAPPTSAAMQVGQLVIIPAVIVIVCVGLALLFGVLAGATDKIENHLVKLEQSSGVGKLRLGLQDPRYKDRWLAAYNVATMIPTIKDDAKKQQVSQKLIAILDNHVSDAEPVLQAYLLLAVGRLGCEGGLTTIAAHLDAEHPQARMGAINGVLSWPDITLARQLTDQIADALSDQSPQVRATAAAALGQLADSGDMRVTDALREAMTAMGDEYRDSRWNAAVALARLGDAEASRFVAKVLLDRDALHERLTAGLAANQPARTTQVAVDRVMLSVLAAANTMNDPGIWAKIEHLAEKDPSRTIRKAARQLTHTR